MELPIASRASILARSSQIPKKLISADPEAFLSERNVLPIYQCFSGKLSSHDEAPTDGIAAVQDYVSWAGR